MDKFYKILDKIKQQIKNNQIEGYKNLIYLYQNIMDNTALIEDFNLFITSLFEDNIILNEEIPPYNIFFSSKIYSKNKSARKQDIINGDF